MRYDSFLSQKFIWKKWFLLGLKCLKKTDLVGIAIFLSVGTAAGLILPVLSQELYQNCIPKGDQQGFLKLGLLLMVFAMGNIAVLILRNLFIFRSLRTMEYTIQSTVLGQIVQLPTDYFTAYESGDLARRIMEVSEWFRGVWNAVTNIVLSGCLSLLYLYSMFTYSPKLAGIVSVILEFSLLLTVVLGICSLRYQEQKMELEGKAAAMAYQLLRGITKIRAAQAEEQMKKVYEKPYFQSKKSAYQKGRLQVIANTVSITAPGICAVIVYQVASRGSSDRETGMFLAFFTALGFCCAAVNQTAEGILEILDIFPLYRRCQPILEAISDQKQEAETSLELMGEIEVERVYFAYGQESVLEDISFHIKSGEYVGIVGTSGCGKSTLLKLLLGFEKPIKGNIYYDGQSIKALNLEALRQNFGVVLQADQLIPGSIYKNITMAAPEATEESVTQVLEEVGLLEEIEQMPMGNETVTINL